MRYIKKSSQNVKERVYTVLRGSTKIVIELFPSRKPALLHQAWPQEHDNVLKLVQVNENKDPVFAAAAWPARVQNFPSFLTVQMKMGPKNLETRNQCPFWDDSICQLGNGKVQMCYRGCFRVALHKHTDPHLLVGAHAAKLLRVCQSARLPKTQR